MNLVIADQSGEYPRRTNYEYPVVVIFKDTYGKVICQRWYFWRASVRDNWYIHSRHRDLGTGHVYSKGEFDSKRLAAIWLKNNAHNYR